MRFAPRIVPTVISSGSTSATLISATESVIVWGILIAHDSNALKAVTFSTVAGTTLFGFGLGTGTFTKEVSMDIPFLCEKGLVATLDLVATADVSFTLFLSNVGA